MDADRAAADEMEERHLEAVGFVCTIGHQDIRV